MSTRKSITAQAPARSDFRQVFQYEMHQNSLKGACTQAESSQTGVMILLYNLAILVPATLGIESLC
jgi:hypothetical protein